MPFPTMYFGPVIAVIWAIFLLYWIACAWGNKRAVQKLSVGFRIIPILGVVGLFRLVHIYPHFFLRQLYARTESVETIGIVLCMLGVALAIWARTILGRNWSGIPQIKEGHELIQAGPYRVVRHPIYTGILLAIFGTGFGRGRMLDVGLFVFCFVTFWIKLKVEESLMSKQFPEAYPTYRKSTKALIPYVL
jgi:protein-S-isoprenylcysteine O-methyltransferase Ste14